MNSKKIKNKYENITTNLKQNFKGQTPLKISDNENQKTNYTKNSNNNINSTTANNMSYNKNRNLKLNQNLNRLNSSINNSKIIITNSNTSLCNNVPKNSNHNNASEKIISPIYQREKKKNSNNNNIKHITKDLKNFKYIFDTYDKEEEKEIKKGSMLYIKTEENKKNNSCKKNSQKKKIDTNKNYFKNINKNNSNSNHNLNILNNKKNIEEKNNLKINYNKKAFTRTFSGCENKRKNSLNSNNNKNSNKNIHHGHGHVLSLNDPYICNNDEKNKNKISYIIFEKDESKKSEEKNLLSKSAKKCEIMNNLGKNDNYIKNQKIKNNNQINRYKGKSPINENSNQTEIKTKENTFINSNNNINIYNIISNINSNNINKNYKKNNIKNNNNNKKSSIKYRQKYKMLKGKNNFSSTKLKNNEKQKYLSNKVTNNNINNNNKYYQKKIEKISKYNQKETKNQKLENINIPKGQININKINEKLLERKKSDNTINSFRKKEIKIYEQSSRDGYIINNEQKSLSHKKEKNNSNDKIKNEKEVKNNIKTKKNNYIKKINNISNYNKKNKYVKDSSKIRLGSVKEHTNYHNNRFSHNGYYKSNCYSESKKNNQYNNNYGSDNNIRGNTTLTHRIKSLSFQNNKLNNYAVVKYPINEIKDDEPSDNKNNKINTEQNKNDIKINVNNCTIIINISSNWGNKKYLGINEIELFDKKNKKIKISECIVIGGNNQNIKNIYNNKMHTMNENNMWVTIIKNQKSSYDLKIKLVIYTSTQNNNNIMNEKNNTDDLFNEINYILIWNYNGIELNKGIKKIEVLDKYGNVYFVGIVPKGEHSITNYYPYKIKIHQNKNSNNNKYNGGLIKNKNLLISSYKQDIDNSIECNNISINHSLAQQNNNKKENENDNKKNLYYSVIRLSSKKEEVFSDIKQFFPQNSNLNLISSSRSAQKDLKKEKEKEKDNKMIATDKKIENKNYKKISNNKKRRIINENKNIDKKEKIKNKNSGNNIKNKSNKLSQGNLLEGITNIKQIIPEEKENNIDNTISIKQNNTFLLSSTDKYYPLKSEYFSENKISILSLSENQNMLLFKKNNSENTLPYILFQKIKINILSNYGNKSFVGLTGLNLIDMHNKIIDIETALSILAYPKDLRTIYKNNNDNRIFENIFNGINNTIDENNMWLTIMNPYPYIEICFEKPMTLSKIEIWNFNEALSLDKGTKEIEIMFDSDENRKYCIMLWKGLGIDYFDYFQTIFVEKLPEITNKTIHLKYNHLKFKYNTNYLPIGFVIKIIFIKNFGDKNIISLKNMEFFDENNKKLDKYIIINDNINMNKKDFFYYHDLFDFKKNEDSICNNLLFVCFEEIVQIKYIKLENTNNEKLIKSSTRYIQIYIDDILIFEGILNQTGESILLFDKKETNNFKNIVNINKKESYYIFKESINEKCCILTNINT